MAKVFEWLCSNKLTLNMKKSKYMIITKKKNICPILMKINGVELKQCLSYKYLGVHFDKDLSWGPHIEYLCSKLSKTCGVMAALRNRVCIEILREVYHALIHSYVRYGILT